MLCLENLPGKHASLICPFVGGEEESLGNVVISF
jgi:hypothetical protein